MGYLEQHGYKQGHATWRFTFPSGKFVYRLDNKHALKYYWRNRDRTQFSIYVRSKTPGWDYVTNNVPAEKCNCGREYVTTNGEPFRYQENPLVLTIDRMIELMKSPVLCQICYYSEELKSGRWAPRAVKRELGLES